MPGHIDDNGKRLILMQPGRGDEWKTQSRFNLQPHEYAAFAELRRYHQNSPKSHFTRAPVSSPAKPDSGVTLIEMRLITTKNG